MRFLLLLSTSLVLALPAWPAGVTDERPRAVGILAGGAYLDPDDEDFQGYEFYLRRDLPWAWTWASGYTLALVANASVGHFHDAERESVSAALGPGFTLAYRDWPVYVDAGSRFTIISEYKFEDLDLGGHLQFTSHFALKVRATGELEVGARVQHLSNAGLYESNPGLDLLSLDLSWRF
jgi:hypothetical protein